MIISKKHKFILVNIPKTGSTSTQATFVNSGILGHGDIYSKYRENPNKNSPPGINIPSDIDVKKIISLSPYDIDHELPILRKSATSSGDITYDIIGHLSPTEMVRLGLLTEKDLKTYKVVGVIRDPIERLVSIWFLFCDIENKSKSKQTMLGMLETGNIYPTTLLGKTQKNYFEYEDELLKNIEPIDFANLNQELDKLITNYGGKTNFYTYENHLRPKWAKGPYRKWLPQETINKLNKILSEDVEFYNRHKKLR